MAKHTPGPWERCSHGSMYYIKAEGGDIVAETEPPATGSQSANADLIAASPEMFTALHDVNTWAHSLPLGNNPEDGVDEIDILERVEYFVEEIWPIVDAALAKADREYVA